MSDKRPNFFIIGAPKCGTTSLTMWLSEHPNIYMSPIKEPMFFCRDINPGSIDTLEKYLRLFERVSDKHVCRGEASTSYLFSKVAVPEIERTFPGSRYIVMLRNPVDITYSLHGQRLRDFGDVEDFEQAWRLAILRRNGSELINCHSKRDIVMLDYPGWCLLGKQLERLYRTVSRDRILVLLLDDVINNPRRQYENVLRFLGIHDDGRIEFPVFNPAQKPKWPRILKTALALRKKANVLREAIGVRGLGLKWAVVFYEAWNERFNLKPCSLPPLSPNMNRVLVSYFEDDIFRLEGLINRGLHEWLKVDGIDA